MNLNASQKKLMGETLNSKGYDLVKTLGSGGDGEVFLVTSKSSNKQYAVKCFENNTVYNKLKKLKNCLNVVLPLFSISVESKDFCFWIYFMEKCRPVSSSIKPEKLLNDILSGIEQLNKNGLEQKDGFRGNILIKPNGNVAISDFSSFGNKESVSNQIEKMLEYVRDIKNIKKFEVGLKSEDKNSIVAMRNAIKNHFRI